MHQPTSALARTVFLAVCLLAGTATVSQSAAAAGWGWGGEHVDGNGVIKRQQRTLGHFTGVASGLSGKVEVRLGNTESVTIETDDNLLPLIDTVVEDGTLRIRPTRRNLNLQTRNMKIVVQAIAVDRLSLGGAGSIDSDPLRGPKVQIDLGGSGSIFVHGIESDAVSVSLGGSGDFKAGAGSARRVSISIGGSGNVSMPQVRSDAVSVSVAGSGEATVWARESLSMTVAGSGDVNYYGDPRVSKTVVGSGTARRLGAAPQ